MTEHYLPDENFTRLTKKTIKSSGAEEERRRQRKLEMQRERENAEAMSKEENSKNHQMIE